VILDYPSASEDDSGEPFSGPNARVIRRNAAEVGIDVSEWKWEYLVRCAPPKDVKVDLKAAVYCSGFLAKAVRKVKPKVIITFGQLSLAAVLGKPDAQVNHFINVPQNAVVAGHECTVYPMQAPWFILKNDYMAEKYLAQFETMAKFLNGDAEAQVREDLSEYGIVTDVDEAIAVCHRMIRAVEKGITIDADTETSGLNPYKVGAKLAMVSVCCNTKRGYCIILHHDEVPYSDEDRQRIIEEGLKPLFTHPMLRSRWQNGKFDVPWFPTHLGFWPRDPVEDTMLTHYSFDENEVHGLKPLALMFTDMGDYDAELDKELDAQTFPDAPRYDKVRLPVIGKYSAMDPVATRKLGQVFRPTVEEQGEAVTALAYRMMPALSVALTDMEFNGIHIDVDITKKVVIPTLTADAKKSWDQIINDPVVLKFCRDREEAARAKMKRPKPIEVKRYFEFSLDSPKQLQELVYGPDYFGHECKVFTKTGGQSTDKEALTDLVGEGSTIAKLVMDFRLDDKMVGTFGNPILARLEEQGSNVLHGSYVIHGTKTGRLSSRSPNLQQIPGKNNGVIKRMFVSRYGDDGVFVQIDYSQVELRVLAALSGDPTMIGVYTNGGDIHTTNACMIFGMTEEEMKALPKDEQKRRRTVAKRVGFGICYGIGGPGIQSTLKSDGVIVDEDTAQSYLDNFLAKYPKVARFLEKIHSDTIDNAYALSPFGRRRRLEQVRSGVNEVKARALRQSGNHVIQSGAGDMTNTSIVLFNQEMRIRRGDDPRMVLPTVDPREFPFDARWKRVHPILQVHDMVGIDCHKDVAADVVDRLLYTMQNVVDLAPLVWGDWVSASLKKLKRVPMLAEAEVGPNWRDAYKVKTGADIPKAMHIARAKRAALDVDIHFKWSEDHEKAAAATFKEVA
jgi:uracil-DNA glycosylase family 4